MRRFFTNLILLCSIACFIFLAAWLNFILTPLVSEPGGLRYQLRPGTSLKTLTANLQEQGLIKHPLFFNLLARLHGNTRELKAGVYLLPRGTTPGRLLDQFTAGKGLLYHVFTIIPGWSFQQLRAALAQEVNLQPTLQKTTDSKVMKLLQAGTLSPEGQFFPDSYYFTEGTTDVKLLDRAFKRMQMKLAEAWLKRDLQGSLTTPYEALIAASLVEKEAHLSAERPVIAGVLLNRLQKKMRLQFDPSIVYGAYQWQQTHPGAAAFNGTIRKQDLLLDTPYNTYLHAGLPPTPIAMPSLDAINAVLHPVRHHYLYFVATGSGGHQFSTTLEEHHLAVLLLRFHEQGFFNEALIRAYLLKRLSLDGQTEARANVLW